MAALDDWDDNDPAAEFLAREQDQLAGLEDEMKPAAAIVTNGALAPMDGSFEMINNLGQPDVFDGTAENNDLDDFLSSDSPFGITIKSEPEESLEDASTSLPADNLMTAGEKKSETPEPQKDLTTQSTPVKPVIREEPEKIKKWREEQKARLEEKDANEEKKKAEMREAAKKELEEWYKHHDELIAKTKADNRNAEKQFVAEADAIEPGTEWERIAKLCDFNPKSSRTNKDVSRMRSIILQLKQSPNPPTVAVKH